MTGGGRRLVVGLVLALAACAPAGPKLGGLAPSGVLPGPRGGVPLAPEHTLTAGDQFEIRFPFAAAYNDRVEVGMDGTVAPKGLGRSVAVGGLTVPEATARLKGAYAKVLKYPELSLTVERYAPELVYVDGWVRRPGLIRADIPMTVARAIAAAGGAKTGAKTSEVLVMRHDKAGHVRTFRVALGNYGGAGSGEDPLLRSFDVVYVPQSAIAAVSAFAQQYYANLPFSASFHIPPTRAPAIVAPQTVAPTPAPAPSVAP